MSTHYAAAQERTLVTADQRGERWTLEDLDFVVAFTESERDEDLAIALGRTLASIWNIQHRLTHEGVEGVRASFVGASRRVASRVEAGWDFVTTFPEGWND